MKRHEALRRALALALAVWGLLPAAAPAQGDPVPYEVSIEGAPDPAMADLLRTVSRTVSLRARPPDSIWLLRRRAEDDIEVLREALQSRGYYGADIALQIRDDAEPVQVVFAIDPGPVYRLESVDFAFPDGAEAAAFDFITPASIGLPPEGPATARRVIDAEGALLLLLRQRGYPFSSVPDRRVVVDHATEGMRVTFQVAPGPRARFGPIEVSGLDTLTETYVHDRAPWDEDDWYNPEDVAELRRRLWESGLFASVQVGTGEEPDEAGRVPVQVQLAERPHRTVSVGVGYQTAESLGARLSWEHRNYTGRGDRLRIETHASSLTLDAIVGYRLPGFRRSDQVLTLDAAAIREDLQAYDSRSVQLGAGIERTVTDRFSWTAGMVLKAARVEQLGEDSRYQLLSFPLGAVWDLRDVPADPTGGSRIVLQLTPYTAVGDSSRFFLKARAEYSRYWQINDATVLAGRVATGTLLGASREDVPPDERFYSGGADSVRGYEFRSLSPLQDNQPVGGSSLLELSLEARRRVTENISVVVFTDAGNAFRGTTPLNIDDLQWGAGLGLRYATPVGPFRADVAVPVNRRSGVDDAFQIYLSFGHTF